MHIRCCLAETSTQGQAAALYLLCILRREAPPFPWEPAKLPWESRLRRDPVKPLPDVGGLPGEVPLTSKLLLDLAASACSWDLPYGTAPCKRRFSMQQDALLVLGHRGGWNQDASIVMRRGPCGGSCLTWRTAYLCSQGIAGHAVQHARHTCTASAPLTSRCPCCCCCCSGQQHKSSLHC